jgi:hypothetical protein
MTMTLPSTQHESHDLAQQQEGGKGLTPPHRGELDREVEEPAAAAAAGIIRPGCADGDSSGIAVRQRGMADAIIIMMVILAAWPAAVMMVAAKTAGCVHSGRAPSR